VLASLATELVFHFSFNSPIASRVLRLHQLVSYGGSFSWSSSSQRGERSFSPPNVRSVRDFRGESLLSLSFERADCLAIQCWLGP